MPSLPITPKEVRLQQRLAKYGALYDVINAIILDKIGSDTTVSISIGEMMQLLDQSGINFAEFTSCWPSLAHDYHRAGWVVRYGAPGFSYAESDIIKFSISTDDRIPA